MVMKTIKSRAEDALFWGKMLAISGSFVALAWTQILGPGVQLAIQEFLSIDEINQRLTLIEETMDVPAVVEWYPYLFRQVGECNKQRCVVVAVGKRTAYGDLCGRPISAEFTIRSTSGGEVEVRPVEGWRPIELGTAIEEIPIPLVIKNTGLRPGKHWWTSSVLYPSCPGPREPVERTTPWVELEISDG